MKSFFRIIVRTGFVVSFVAALTLRAQDSSAGTRVTGHVSNAATQSYLEGAVVAIDGTDRSVITDREGRYEFAGITSESVTLVVSFSGLDTQKVTVVAAPGRRTVRDVQLTSQIYQLEKFTVAGEREGMAKAQVLQRQAPNVKNVVASDAFGNVADGNIGYLLQHVVGITPVLDGIEVRAISVRGVTSELTTVTLDGQQQAQSPQAGVIRRFDFNQQSLANIETIEVTKAPTPDMDAAAIGGSVNLITKSAFDRAGGRSIDYSVGVAHETSIHFPAPRWKEPIKGISPSLSLNYRDVFGEHRNFGVAVNATYFNIQTNGISHREVAQNQPLPGPVFTHLNARTLSNKNRLLASLGIKLEYRWSDYTTISVGLTNNYSSKFDYNPAITTTTAQTIATVDAAGNRTGGGAIHPNFADGITRIFPVAQSTVTITSPHANTVGTTRGFQPTLRSKVWGWDLVGALNYSVSNTKIDRIPDGAMTVRLANVGWQVDRSKDARHPIITQTHGVSMYDLNNYTGELENNLQKGSDTIRSAKLDVRRNLAIRFPTYLKAGLSYNVQQRRVSLVESMSYFYTGPDGIQGNADDTRGMAQFLDTEVIPVDDKKFLRYFRDPGGNVPFPDSIAAGRHQRANPHLWSQNFGAYRQAMLLASRKGTEKIGAAYAMGNMRLGPISILAGMRFDETHRIGVGPVTLGTLPPAEVARRAAWGTAPLTREEAERRADLQYGNRQTNRGSYRNSFPSVHLKYEPIKNVITRASWTTSVGRPSFGSIIPLETVNDTNRTVTASNPNLQPQYANSFDLSAEYYFKSQGKISVGVFRKDIEDYIFTDSTGFVEPGLDNGFQGQYEGYRLTTQSNRGTARIDGLEVDFQKPLNFLPGWAKGFSFNANLTLLKTFGDYGAATPIATNSLANFINQAANAGLGYRGYGFDLKAQVIYSGEYINVVNASPGLVNYYNPRTTWSWKSTYAFSNRMSLFLDVDNVFSTMITDLYQGYKDRPNIYSAFPIKIVAGIRGRF